MRNPQLVEGLLAAWNFEGLGDYTDRVPHAIFDGKMAENHEVVSRSLRTLLPQEVLP